MVRKRRVKIDEDKLEFNDLGASAEAFNASFDGTPFAPELPGMEAKTYRVIPIKDVVVKEQVRLDLGEVKELAESIKEKGLIQPVIVVPSEDNPGKYELVAGHRRLEAVKLLGKKSIEAVVYPKKPTDAEKHVIQLHENVKRKDLNFAELAFAVGALVVKLFEGDEETARALGVEDIFSTKNQDTSNAVSMRDREGFVPFAPPVGQEVEDWIKQNEFFRGKRRLSPELVSVLERVAEVLGISYTALVVSLYLYVCAGDKREELCRMNRPGVKHFRTMLDRGIRDGEKILY